MRSPKFSIRKDELRSVLNKATLKSAWRNTVRFAMRRQYLADPIELMDFHSRISIECDLLESEIMDGGYIPRKPSRVLVEKSKGLCRQVTVLNVRDALVIQCLSDAFYTNIKGKAPSKNAFFEPERHLFTGPLNEKRTYGSFRSWLEFQKNIFNFSRTRRYIVVSDITNFYDYISHAHLRNVITDYVEDVRESILDLLIFMFSELNWQPDYMPRTGVGLPQIDLDAPRLLAHCFLYELDRTLVRRNDIDYVRFMDDIDIGVDSIPAAKELLRDIDLTLQSRQVRLNSGKTKILSNADAIKHFKIMENEELDALETLARENPACDRTRLVLRDAIGLRMARWYNEKVFDTGNGEKILKRLFGLSIRFGAGIPRAIIDDCLLLRPALRESVYRFMCFTSPNMDVLNSILDYLESNYAIDDASYVEFANYLVDSTCQFDQGVIDRIYILLERIVRAKTEPMLYSTFTILSKLGDLDAIAKTIESTFDQWKSDYMIGRVVGSLWPSISESRYEHKYLSLLGASRNLGAREVVSYLKATANDREKYLASRNVVKSPNKSFPNKITHRKFIVLRAILGGHALDRSEKSTLRRLHRPAAKDPYYATIVNPASAEAREVADLSPFELDAV
jgi:hypothetical protein